MKSAPSHRNNGDQPQPVTRRGAVERNLRAVALTLTTGSTDAVCFLHLGHVFGSVITGNLVLLGVAASTRASALARYAATALGGYAAGVLAGAPIARERDRGPGARRRAWPAQVTACLAVELVVLAGFAAAWDLAGGRPTADGRLVLLALAAAAMGMQSAAVRRLGQISTTYLTSTLTGVLAALVVGDIPEGLGRSVGVLAAVVAGAAAGAVTAAMAPVLLPLVTLIPLAAVIASAPQRDRL